MRTALNGLLPGALILGFLGSAIAGCGGLSKPYPEKNLYAIEVAPPAATEGASSAAALRVQNIRMAAPYDGTTFVYKMSESRFTSDYYNGFVAEPGHLLTGELSGWLARCRVFKSVVNGTSAADARYLLETNVTALYGDYATKDGPKAVLEARFILIDQRGGPYRVVFDKTYRETEPLTSKAPEALVQGWGADLQRMFTSLVSDIQSSTSMAGGQATP